MKLKVLLYDLCHAGLRLVRTNRWLIRRLFGVRIPPDVLVQFDPTTILLAKSKYYLRPGSDHHSFEVGIGQGSLISLSLAVSRGLEVSGVDCMQGRVESSLRVAAFNEIQANYFQSDLFSKVNPEARFDVILFNPPYVPTDVGKDLQLTRRLELDGDQMWDGGSDGTDVLREFLLQAPRFLASGGRIVFGVQNIFVSDEKISQTVERANLKLERRFKSWFIPSTGYVVSPGESGSESRQSTSEPA